jgi:hypothetical protein
MWDNFDTRTKLKISMDFLAGANPPIPVPTTITSTWFSVDDILINNINR